MTTTFPARVAFEDHRTVRALDLEDEQLYHVERRWQHNLALHSWGILVGLDVQVENPDRQHPRIIIRPGMALDGYGRELIVNGRPLVVAGADEEATGLLPFNPAITYDLWLAYNAILEENDALTASEPREDCCSKWPSTGQPRINEQPQVLVTRSAERISGSITHPQGVPLEDVRGFSPAAPMKFDPASRWPVFLCRLEFLNGAWQVDNTERHYGGLIAERISAPIMSKVTADAPPQRTTSVIIGGESENSEYRFAVMDTAEFPNPPRDLRKSPDTDTAPLSIRTVMVPSEKGPTSQTEIRMEAEQVVAECNVMLENGAGLLFESAPVEANTPSPSGWGIYRRFEQPPRSGAGETNKEFADALHIAMPKSSQGTNSIAIGSVDSKGDFQEILVVHENDSVEIHGMLRVHGAIYGITTDLPLLDDNRQLKDLATRLPDAMKRTCKEVLISLVQVVLENATANRTEAIQDSKSKVDIVKEVLGIALQVLTAIDTFTSVTTKADDSKIKDLYHEFVRTALKKLNAQSVYDDLKAAGPQDQLDALYKLFLTDAVGRLGETSVYEELHSGTNFKNLCEVFAQDAIKDLGADEVFNALKTSNDLRNRFVELAAKDAAEFVAAIPTDKLAVIVAEAFSKQTPESLEGFKTTTPAARKPVWEAGWTVENLQEENVKTLPDDNPVIASVASEMNTHNPVVAKKLRDALTALIGDGGP